MPQPITFSLRPTRCFPLARPKRCAPLSPGTVFLNPATSNANWNIDLGRLIALWQTGSGNALGFADTAKSDGYCEAYVVSAGTGTFGIGFVPGNYGAADNTDYIHNNGVGFLSTGFVNFANFSAGSYTATAYGSVHLVGIAKKNGKFYAHLDGVWQGNGAPADPNAETGGVDISTMGAAPLVIPAVFTNGTGAQVIWNYGATPFAYPDHIPSGIKSWDGSQGATTNAYSLSCVTGAFTLSGQANVLAAVVSFSTGSFALTGNAAGLPVIMAASRGIFTLTGTATTPGVAMPASAGAFSLTGATAGLSHGYRLAITAGTFALTGNAAGLIAARRITAATGTFILSGQAVALPVVMSALTGAFALTFQASTLAVTIPMARGVFTLTGIAATVKAARLLSASTGVFVLTGNAAGLNKVGSSTLAAATGIFSLTGIAASALRGARLSAGVGSFVLSGAAASLRSARLLTASRGAFALTGASVAAIHQARLSLTAGAFNLTGFAAAQTRQSRLQAATGTFALTGLAARILTIVLPTPESRSVAGVLIGRGTAGTSPSRRTAPNLQPRRSAG